MTVPDAKPTREQRLSERLRENLRRRKLQARALKHDGQDDGPGDTEDSASALSKPDSSR